MRAVAVIDNPPCALLIAPQPQHKRIEVLPYDLAVSLGLGRSLLHRSLHRIRGWTSWSVDGLRVDSTGRCDRTRRVHGMRIDSIWCCDRHCEAQALRIDSGTGCD